LKINNRLLFLILWHLAANAFLKSLKNAPQVTFFFDFAGNKAKK